MISSSNRKPVSPPWLAAAGLIAAIGSSLLLFWIGGAPVLYIPISAASLVLALAIMFAPPSGGLRSRGAAVVVALCLAGIGATLVSGFDLDGVRRWLPLGPVRLHASMLLLPAMLAALPHLPARWQLAAVIATAGIALLQPDLALAAALAIGFGLSHGRRWREPPVAVGYAVVLFAVLGTAFLADTLVAVRFVEQALLDGWLLHPALGLLLMVALSFAILAPVRLQVADRDSVLGVAGAWLGFTAASLVRAHPTPLVGYGPAAILGYGLAIMLLRSLPSRP